MQNITRVFKIHANDNFVFKRVIIYYIGVYHEGFNKNKGEVVNFKNSDFLKNLVLTCVLKAF